MEEEEWRGILHFPDYQISSQSRVRRISSGLILKRSIDNRVTLTRYGDTHTRNVFELMKQAFPELG